MRRIDNCALLAVCLATFGCDSGSEAPPDVTVTVVHAAPSYGVISFLREERNEETIAYNGASRFEFDADTYDFNLATDTPGQANSNRILTFTQEISPERDYVFVLTEVGGLIAPWILEKPEFDPGSSDSEVMVVHAAPPVAAVDVYLEPAGTDLSTANALGNVGFMEDLAPMTIAPGDYELSLTEPGNPGNVLFSSFAQTLEAGQSNIMAITDGANQGLAPLFAVRVSGGAVGPLLDRNLASGLRVINGAADGMDRDIIANGEFAMPFIPGLPYAVPSGYESLAPDNNNVITVTPAGNPSVSETELTVQTIPGRLYTVLISGDSADLASLSSLDDWRSITGEARVTVMNAANRFEVLNLYIFESGTDVTTKFPNLQMTTPALPQPLRFVPGTYDLVLQDGSTAAIVAGPIPITLDDGGVYSILALNGADASTATVELLDGF